ncbi:MAG TPA: hypothetical protein VKP69_12775 [Isosphaeraceae bacterium]|jgi:hypothetical protein|nr:hypothetical protein [Isosphaeraceae bacterium]
MDDSRCRQYFLAPQETSQRRYEALRAVFVDGEPLDTVAQRFGYTVATLKSMACRFRADCRRGVTPPFSFRTVADALSGPAVAKTDTGPNYPRSRTAGG